MKKENLPALLLEIFFPLSPIIKLVVGCNPSWWSDLPIDDDNTVPGHDSSSTRLLHGWLCRARVSSDMVLQLELI